MKPIYSLIAIVTIGLITAHAEVAATASPSTVTILLPLDIDPFQKPVTLEHGTRVYKGPSEFSVSYRMKREDGSIASYTFGYRESQHITKDATHLIVHHADGKTSTFPLDAVVDADPRHGENLAFIAPEMPIPPELRNRKPDYIVP